MKNGGYDKHSDTAVRSEGGSPEITDATGKEAREPKTYLLYVRRAKPLDYSPTINNGYVAGSIPGSDKKTKKCKGSRDSVIQWFGRQLYQS